MNKFSNIWSLIAVSSTTYYNPAWANGTGYFDGLIEDVSLQQERVNLGLTTFVTTSTDTHGRKMLIIVSEQNTVVFFQRFNDAEDNDRVIVNNASRELKCEHLNSQLKVEFINQWFSATTTPEAIAKMEELLDFLCVAGAAASAKRNQSSAKAAKTSPEAEAAPAAEPVHKRPLLKTISDNKVAIGVGVATLAAAGAAAYYYYGQRAE
jgi:hypothetical protein